MGCSRPQRGAERPITNTTPRRNNVPGGVGSGSLRSIRPCPDPTAPDTGELLIVDSAYNAAGQLTSHYRARPKDGATTTKQSWDGLQPVVQFTDTGASAMLLRHATGAVALQSLTRAGQVAFRPEIGLKYFQAWAGCEQKPQRARPHSRRNAGQTRYLWCARRDFNPRPIDP